MTQYQSIDVFDWRNVRQVVQGSDANLVLLANPTGKDVRDQRQDRPRMSMSLEVPLKTRAEIAAFKAFLETRAGRLNPFWIPTWDCDLKVTQTYTNPAGTSTLRFRRTEFTDAYKQTAMQRARAFIYLHKPDGGYEFRYVTDSATISADEEQITIQGAITDCPLMPDTFDVICFLDFVRLDSDRIEFAWDSPDHCIVKLRLLVLQYDVGTIV